MSSTFHFQRIAVLGAGVMGAQIAAHCVNAGLPVKLFDLAAEGPDKNAIVNKAIERLAKLNPPPLADVSYAAYIKACNYEEHLKELGDCDLVIEAIGERMDWKEDLYNKIAPHMHENAVLVSNTSGLSINTLCSILPPSLQQRFCGVHFFNPPRYMHLAELIPANSTDPSLLDSLETWLTRQLGKGVIRAKDTPNFIANRVGVFSLIATMHHAERLGLGLDEADALTGTLVGRPKSATFRTMDVVGLDTMQHVVHTMQEQLKDDPWYSYFKLPEWLNNLISDGHLGQKTGQGIYRKQGKTIEVFDYKSGTYRASEAKVDKEVMEALKQGKSSGLLAALQKASGKQAEFLLACFCDLFHYCAVHLKDIADTTRDVDLAIRWGFGWLEGPFETWQKSGIKTVNDLLKQRISDNQAMAETFLPDWLQGLDAFYEHKGAYSPKQDAMQPRSKLAVYQRQFTLDRVLAEKEPDMPIIYENEGVALWDLGDDIAVLSFRSKSNTVGQAVLDGMLAALDKAEESCQGLILYQHNPLNFSSGADLEGVAQLLKANKVDALTEMVAQFQQVAMRLKYSSIPTVAALRGRALGGGCELMMHCGARVAAFESYPGLVELGVGVIPAGGGCKEFALRAASRAVGPDPLLFVQPYFEQIAMANVASSAVNAHKRDFLSPQDTIVMHVGEVLLTAKRKVQYMQAANYLPPQSSPFKVAGREGAARLQAGLVNWREGGFISAHDYQLASRLAYVLCGGDVNEGALVDEQWMLKLERDVFVEMAMTEKSQARIHHLLETGKPLRN